MFNLKLDVAPAYWWDVELLIVAESGAIVVHKIGVLYHRMSVDEFGAFQREIVAESLDDVAVARRIMRNMRGVGEDGTELPFNDENRDKLLSVEGAASAIVGGWYLSRNQAHLGNLTRSRELGRASTTAAASTAAKT